ncbi:MAG: cell division protein FtsQ/DivIB [Candidatus Nanopelagicales bacterium]
MVNEIRALKRRKWAIRLLTLLPVLLISSGAFYLVYFSDIFAVKTISVQGSKIVPEHSIIDAAMIPLGTPLAKIDSETIQKNLSKFPSVGSVEIRRVWPSEIVLAISERMPVATMAEGGTWRFVDEFGVMYGESSKVPDGLIPITANSTAARAAIAGVIQAIPDSIKRQVLTISAETKDSVELRLTSNRTVFWGSSTQTVRKIKVLEVLLTKNARLYDVSAPNFPTTRN